MLSSLWRRESRCKVGASDSLIKEAQKAVVIHSKHTFYSHLVSIEQQYAVGSGPVDLRRTEWCIMLASLYPQVPWCGCVTLLGVTVNDRSCCCKRRQSTRAVVFCLLYLHWLTPLSFAVAPKQLFVLWFLIQASLIIEVRKKIQKHFSDL